jgi:dynein heavy chain
MSPRSLGKRVVSLIDSITLTAFFYTRRGLFEKHKLLVTTMLTLRIMLKANKLSKTEVDHLILGKFDANAPTMPDVLKNFVSD